MWAMGFRDHAIDKQFFDVSYYIINLVQGILDYFLNDLGPMDVSDAAPHTWRVKTLLHDYIASRTSSPTLLENLQN